jgi:hypothetical protein
MEQRRHDDWCGNPNKVGYKHLHSQSYYYKSHTNLPSNEGESSQLKTSASAGVHGSHSARVSIYCFNWIYLAAVGKFFDRSLKTTQPFLPNEYVAKDRPFKQLMVNHINRVFPMT